MSDKPNSGALFKNEYKERDNQPDYKGPFTGPNGEEMEIAAWLRESKGGKKYMSVSVSEKRQRQEAPQSGASRQSDAAPFNDDIPFAPRHWLS